MPATHPHAIPNADDDAIRAKIDAALAASLRRPGRRPSVARTSVKDAFDPCSCCSVIGETRRYLAESPCTRSRAGAARATSR